MRSDPTVPFARQAWLVIAVAGLGPIGCGSGDAARVVVQGRVHFNDTAVENGLIRFVPTGEGRVAGGTIIDGAYRIDTHGGVPPGTYRVEITAFRNSPGETFDVMSGSRAQYLPEQFNRRSELRATITGDVPTARLDFDLQP